MNKKRLGSHYSLCFCLTAFLACAPVRTAVPAGTIPAPHATSIDDEQYGHQVLQEFSEQYEVDYNDPRLDNIQKVVDRLTKAAGADSAPWHVYLFKAPTVKNAAATRGNHVFVWSGIFNSLKSDEELATILGHEIAHVVAGHTDPDPNEEARRIMVNIGAIAAQIAVATVAKDPTLANNLGSMAGSVTQSVGEGALINPYSREIELEADHIGLMIMAKAGYDPHAAVEFWRRAQEDPAFSSGFEFFSTHPQAVDRWKKLEAALPLAIKYYEGKATDIQNVIPPTKTPPRESQAAAPVRAQKRTPQPEWPQRWTVDKNRAVLFEKPSADSRALGEFNQGAQLRAVSRNGEWLEIVKPDHGYIHQSMVRRTRIPRLPTDPQNQ